MAHVWSTQPAPLSDRFRVGKARAHVSVLRLVWDEWAEMYVRRVVSEATGTNLLTSAGIVQTHAQTYGTSGLLSNGFVYIGLSADMFSETAASTTLSSEITTNGLGRALATVTLPTGTGTIVTLRKVFSVTGTQVVRKAALFTASSSGVMQHPLMFDSPQSLVNTDQFQVTFTVDLG